MRKKPWWKYCWRVWYCEGEDHELRNTLTIKRHTNMAFLPTFQLVCPIFLNSTCFCWWRLPSWSAVFDHTNSMRPTISRLCFHVKNNVCDPRTWRCEALCTFEQCFCDPTCSIFRNIVKNKCFCGSHSPHTNRNIVPNNVSATMFGRVRL